MPSVSTRIGAHISIAGGIIHAPERAAAQGCETFQCFTRSPQGGPAPELTEEVLATFRGNMDQYGMDTFHIHAPYYINLASTTPRIRMASVRILREELERGSKLGAAFVMFHPGSHAGQTYEDGADKAREALAKILDGYTGSCGLLVEISAGAGNVLGDTFREVGDIIAASTDLPGFAGVCFDTCHAFASGYDFTTPEKARETLSAFDVAIGLKWLKLTHVNDSQVALGGKRDRHEHIGKGFIGSDGLTALLSTPEFRRIDWLLETQEEGRKEDIQALRNIRKG